MSASREKKRRQELYQAGEPKGKKQPTETKTPGWKKALYWCIGVVFVIAFVAVLLFNSSFFARHSTAMTVGEHKLSPAMVDMYYSNSYMDFYNTYGDYASYFFDSTKSLSEQIYNEETGETWSDYFMTSAKSNMVQAYTLYDLAVKEGYALTDEEKAAIDANVASYKDASTEYGYSSINGYLNAFFGNGVNEKTYREFLGVQYLAARYYSDKIGSFSFTDEDKAAFYAKSADEYDTVSLEYSYIRGAADPHTETDEDGNETTVDPTEEESAAAMDAARAQAKELMEGGHDAMEEYDLRSLTDTSRNTLSYVLPAEASDWLYDASRTEGDMETFESGAAVYVVRFLSRSTNDYLTKNIRLVQLTPETVENVQDADGNVDTEATAAAQQTANEVTKAKAQSLYEDWQDGDATEESFAEMADTESDAGLTTEGGLVENVPKNQFSASVSEWLYADGRKAGDSEVFVDSDNCYLVYFLGDGELYQYVLVENAILQDAYETWYNDASASYEVTENKFGMRFVSTR